MASALRRPLARAVLIYGRITWNRFIEVRKCPATLVDGMPQTGYDLTRYSWTIFAPDRKRSQSVMTARRRSNKSVRL